MPFSSNIKLSKTNKKPSKKPTFPTYQKRYNNKNMETSLLQYIFPTKAIIHPITKAT